MNGQRVIAVALLVAALFVLGTLSASLDATVTSTPDDVIDVDTDSLPFAGDGASEIADSYKQGESDEPERQVGGASSDPGSGESGEPPGADAGDAGGESPPADAGGGPEGDRASEASSQQGQDGDQGGSDAQEGDQGGTDGGQSDQGTGDSFTDSLWGILAQFAELFLLLLGLLLALAVGRIAVRRREGIAAWLRNLAERYGLLPDETSNGVPVPDGEGEARTVVERAWGEMIAASSADPHPSDTPRECARAVVETGAHPEPVEALTETYERVRYGGGSITPDDASRALTQAREAVPGSAGDVVGDGDPDTASVEDAQSPADVDRGPAGEHS